MDIKKKNELVNKYTKRIEIDYPEADKIAIDLSQFADEIVKLLNLHDVVQRSELLKFADWQDKEGHIETFEFEGVRGLMKEFGIL